MLDKSKTKNEATTGNDESEKRKKFVELAENRTRNAIKAIRTVAKLGNRNAYEFDDADVKKIASALMKEVDALKDRMSSKSGKEQVDFTL